MVIPHPTTCSYPLREGNAVRPLIDGVPTFRRIGKAIDGAQRSVWLTVAYYAPDFQMPDERGSLFDLLDGAVVRGLDVRVIFWRPNPEYAHGGRTFPGSPADRDLLRARASTFRVRWDRAHGHYLHHQKSWLIDAGQPSEVAFIGGINLTAQALGAPGHAEGNRHDTYVEISGPAATDVHHSFVQRWNEASERALDDGRWSNAADDQLPFRRAYRGCGKTASCRFNAQSTPAATRMGGRALVAPPTTSSMVSGRSSINTFSPSAQPKRPSTSKTKRSRSRRLPTRLKKFDRWNRSLCPSGDITGGFASRRHWVGSGSSPCTSLVKGRRTGKTGGKSPRPRNGPPKPSPG